jgi:putative ABC transport system permease protein
MSKLIDSFTPNLLMIALKNLGRHKTKTLLTMTAIAVGIFIYIWEDAWFLGINLDSKRNLVNYESGAAKIYSKAYFNKKNELPLYESFSNSAPIIKKLEEKGYNAAPHAVFLGTLISQEQELPFKILGIDPEKEKRVFPYYKFIEPPNQLAKEDFENNILAKMSNSQDLNYMNDNYLFNNSDNLYHLKVINFENNSNALKIQAQITQLESRAGIKNIDQKISRLKTKYKLLIKKQERNRLDKIRNQLNKVNYNNFIKNGSFEALIGIRGARDLNVSVGDDVRLYTIIDLKDEFGAVRQVHQLISLKIAGIVNSPNPKNIGNIIYVPLDILQDERGILLNGKVSEICIRKKGAKEYELPGKDESPEYISAQLGTTLTGDLILVDWKEEAKEYLAKASQDIAGLNRMIFLLFILVVFGIVNTMLMAVYERTKEIGMMRSLGMKDFDILKLFLYEAGLIGLIGSLIGVILGILINIPMVKYGFDFSAAIEQFNRVDFGYRVVGIFKSAWNWRTIILSGILATVISGFSALIPAYKAIKMNIVDTLRFE